jgi:predicted nucleotide-binding protein (sugar kinase/HSP70/actin superfamily)
MEKAQETKPKNRVAVFPKLGDYAVPLNIMIRGCLNCQTIDPPPITKRTVEIGAKHSPDTVCTPFKIIMGQFIESLGVGANALVMPAFGCRLGFYDILHKQILEDMGYKFEMLTLFEYYATANKLFASLSGYNPDLTREQFDKIIALTARIVLDMDELHAILRKNAAFQIKAGTFESAYKNYLTEAKTLKNQEAAVDLGNKYRKIFSKIETRRPENPIRIGLVGDLYSVIEPHGNCEIEKWLIAHGVEIVRDIDLTYLTKFLFDVNALIAKSGGYVNYQIGGNANNTVALAYQYCNSPKAAKVDGLIHMKAATCTPEISAMTILQNISRDFETPIMFLTFDTETGEAGLHTRLEAFLDMLAMKKEKI